MLAYVLALALARQDHAALLTDAHGEDGTVSLREAEASSSSELELTEQPTAPQTDGGLLCADLNPDNQRLGNQILGIAETLVCAKQTHAVADFTGWGYADLAELPADWSGRQCEQRCKWYCSCAQPEETRVSAKRAAARELLLPRFAACDDDGAEDEVVLHLRSGDIMRPDPYGTSSGWYPQPPCSFYEHVITRGNDGEAFPKARIITEPDMANPCVASLRDRFEGSSVELRVQAGSLAEDTCSLRAARNLAASFGTFVPALMLLNQDLRRVFVPFGEDQGTKYPGGQLAGLYGPLGPGFWKLMFQESPAEYDQHLYSFPDYETVWQDPADRARIMRGYPLGKVLKRSVLADGRSSVSELDAQSALVKVSETRVMSLSLLTTVLGGSRNEHIDEIYSALAKNLANPYISAAHVFYESGGSGSDCSQLASRVLTSDPGKELTDAQLAKVHCVPAAANPTYADLFAYADATLWGQPTLLANADIVFSETLGLLQPEAFAEGSRGYVLSALPPANAPEVSGSACRTMPRCTSGAFDGWTQGGDSWDAYIFLPPVHAASVAIPMNHMGAENRAAAALECAGVQLFNPCYHVHAYHLHCKGEKMHDDKSASLSTLPAVDRLLPCWDCPGIAAARAEDLCTAGERFEVPAYHRDLFRDPDSVRMCIAGHAGATREARLMQVLRDAASTWTTPGGGGKLCRGPSDVDCLLIDSRRVRDHYRWYTNSLKAGSNDAPTNHGNEKTC